MSASVCDNCKTIIGSNNGYPLTHCHGMKLCPVCFQKWQKGLIKNISDDLFLLGSHITETK